MNLPPNVDGTDLIVDFCSHEAARYACKNYHYLRTMPVGAIVKIGAWEHGKFIGAILFAHGATLQIGMPYDLGQFECVELARVALTAHCAPVTQIIAKAIRLLKRQSPGLKLIVSYSDPDIGHHGGIYQAGNWIYQGQTGGQTVVRLNGKIQHRRALNSQYGTSKISELSSRGFKTERIKVSGRHKYLYPLDRKARKKILSLHQPYPSRALTVSTKEPPVY